MSKKYLAIVLYRCYVDDVYDGSLDIQVQYFEGNDESEVDSKIRAADDNDYVGGDGNQVTWKLDEIVCIEESIKMVSGDEVIGFIRDEKDFKHRGV